MNCWEYFNCGFAQGGNNTKELGVCPVYPNQGTQCARVSGTLCRGKKQGVFASKLAGCMKCEFYLSPNYDRSYSKS
jgi:hypothetical protein